MARAIDANELLGIERLLDTDVVRQSKTASWLLDQVLHDIQAMPTLTPPNEWVSVEDRLPGVTGKYIACVKDNMGARWTICADWSVEMKSWFGEFGEIKNKVTHWMPLPAPPNRHPPEGEEDT